MLAFTPPARSQSSCRALSLVVTVLLAVILGGAGLARLTSPAERAAERVPSDLTLRGGSAGRLRSRLGRCRWRRRNLLRRLARTEQGGAPGDHAYPQEPTAADGTLIGHVVAPQAGKLALLHLEDRGRCRCSRVQGAVRWRPDWRRILAPGSCRWSPRHGTPGCARYSCPRWTRPKVHRMRRHGLEVGRRLRDIRARYGLTQNVFVPTQETGHLPPRPPGGVRRGVGGRPPRSRRGAARRSGEGALPDRPALVGHEAADGSHS